MNQRSNCDRFSTEVFTDELHRSAGPQGWISGLRIDDSTDKDFRAPRYWRMAHRASLGENQRVAFANSVRVVSFDEIRRLHNYFGLDLNGIRSAFVLRQLTNVPFNGDRNESNVPARGSLRTMAEALTTSQQEVA